MMRPIFHQWPMLVSAILIISAGPCRAHDSWLIPERFAAMPPSELRLDLTSGMAFPDLDHSINPDRMGKSGFRLAGKEVKLPPVASDKSLRFQARLTDAGIATIWVQLKPRPIELNEKQVAEYLDEIGASEPLRKTWAAAKERRWREIYTKHAKTFVRVGNPTTDRSWAEPVGLGLELIPKNDPTTLHTGDSLPIIVLKNGRPLTGFVLSGLSAGKQVGAAKVTDKNGIATIDLTKPGPWLLHGTDLRTSQQIGTEWESDFATLTIEVRAK